ncbi:hypothetical protein PoB_002468100 [Plakobranchus ocellatus]|uniref:Secreted protein n=1 Tax=Plakobranchus ocellatus TaxID=259542 RepID=A0AAV3ZQD3_9GAST|nr:hypothetical protein PoB_002468100 [Plakobranchus ocellatus]
MGSAMRHCPTGMGSATTLHFFLVITPCQSSPQILVIPSSSMHHGGSKFVCDPDVAIKRATSGSPAIGSRTLVEKVHHCSSSTKFSSL